MKQIEFEPGQMIDNRYKIISHLGEGGMGAVWKASDARTNDSIVVLKFPLKYNDSEILERFATEAGTMRALAGDCDNILDIQDIGNVAINQIDNVPYYVMRFQTGGQLRDWQLPKDEQGNAIYSPDGFKWVSGVATALDFLHHQADPVYHRDVKPENILFNASGTPKLADFGIVKNIKKATTNITQTGAAMGTVAYMPPEIWRGGKFSPASDQFSFVSTVYEMIAGRRPYEGETPFAMLESLHKGHQKLSETIGFPAAASAALDRGLSHEPGERFESCGAFTEAFLAGLQQTPPIAQPLPPSELETGMHQSGVLPGDSAGNGSAVIGGQPVAPVPPPTHQPQGLSPGSNPSGAGGSLFAEATPKPVQPIKPTTPATSGFPWPAVIGVSLLLLGLIGGGLAFSGAFSGNDQPTGVSPGSSANPSLAQADPVEREEVTEEVGSSTTPKPPKLPRELSSDQYKESSLSLVEAHAELGFAGAETELGFRASKSGDDKTALSWYRKAEKKNYMRALNNLGHFYKNGRGGITKDESKAFEYFQRAIDADPDFALAQYNLGVCYAHGQGVRKDETEAVKWYRRAAEQGFDLAQRSLGIMYANGHGVRKDETEAVKWYRKAAEQDYASAQYSLGVMYRDGKGVRKDEAEAVKWYRKAAEQGYAYAQHNLGVMYTNGRGVSKDFTEAVKWYRKAAEQDHASAQTQLGLMYVNGRGVEKDEREAVRWYRKGAEQGNSAAQYSLGFLYDHGKGVVEDDHEAFKWYLKAAEQGDSDAEFNVGNMYENGHGVDRDKAEAIEWYRKAMAHGHKKAKATLNRLED